MKMLQKNIRMCFGATLATVVVLVAGCSGMSPKENMLPLTLSGGQEVPPVSTTATAQSTVRVAADKSISGNITTTGVAGTMAHIHIAREVGANGPVIVPLKKTADNVFSVPENATLSDDQYAAYKAGLLYVNVHSAAHPAGEIRAQLPAS
jgi:hypothetical protein